MEACKRSDRHQRTQRKQYETRKGANDTLNHPNEIDRSVFGAMNALYGLRLLTSSLKVESRDTHVLGEEEHKTKHDSYKLTSALYNTSWSRSSSLVLEAQGRRQLAYISKCDSDKRFDSFLISQRADHVRPSCILLAARRFQLQPPFSIFNQDRNNTLFYGLIFH